MLHNLSISENFMDKWNGVCTRFDIYNLLLASKQHITQSVLVHKLYNSRDQIRILILF